MNVNNSIIFLEFEQVDHSNIFLECEQLNFPCMLYVACTVNTVTISRGLLVVLSPVTEMLLVWSTTVTVYINFRMHRSNCTDFFDDMFWGSPILVEIYASNMWFCFVPFWNALSGGRREFGETLFTFLTSSTGNSYCNRYSDSVLFGFFMSYHML